MTHGSLFAGIGGFDFAAQMAGIENVFQVEKDKFCLKVLEKNFPEVKRYEDIKDFDGRKYKGTINIISGGFPCQPFSVAGNRKGKEDDRYLWDEMLGIIAEIEPQWVIAENVPGLLAIEGGLVFENILTDLETEGYEVQPFIIPALGKNAPHKRDRVWIIANTQKAKCQWSGYSRKRQSGFTNISSSDWFKIAAGICRIDNGIPTRVDRRKRLMALGNAIVPQVAYEIFNAILETYFKR